MKERESQLDEESLFLKYRGKIVIIFMKNGFRFKGQIKQVRKGFVEFYDNKERRMMLINISQISEVKTHEDF